MSLFFCTKLWREVFKVSEAVSNKHSTKSMSYCLFIFLFRSNSSLFLKLRTLGMLSLNECFSCTYIDFSIFKMIFRSTFFKSTLLFSFDFMLKLKFESRIEDSRQKSE